MRRLIAASFMAWICGGCVERTLTVSSDPPGALVFLNDQEVGRTPFSKRFLWYGTYEVQVRKEGYTTLITKSPVIAPWWQWMPFDLVAELAPLQLEDSHTVSYSLKPLSEQEMDPRAVVRRGEDIRSQLDAIRVRPAQSQPAQTRTSN